MAGKLLVLENNDTISYAYGEPFTIDVGWSLAFRAQGAPRVLSGTVDELTSMRTGPQAGQWARAMLAQLIPDSTDARFVAGVERVAAIRPAEIEDLVSSSMPSLSVQKRADLADTLVKRRPHLARTAGVAL